MLFSLIGIIFLIPFYLVVGILILFIMGKPILFTQTRPGRDGKLFTIYKFRTMRFANSSEGSDYDRITPLGNFLRRTSIDEIPELFNVFAGHMSFVGPRPLLLEYVPLYNSFQNRRHEVRPGITGLAQINGRNKSSWEQRFSYDVKYVDEYSFWLDIKILTVTIFRVIKRKDINQGERITVSTFTGSGNEENQ